MTNADTIVIGGGLAGLAAARALEASGRSAAVVEARDRVGGRVVNAAIDGGDALELGGEWIGHSQDRMYELVDELGLETYPTYGEGKNLLLMRGKLRHYSGAIPRVGGHVLLDVALARLQLARQSRRIDTEAPWRSPRAERLDSESFASWVRRNVRTHDARTMIALAGKTVWGAEPAEMSALHALFYARSAGGFERLVDTKEGAQRDRIVGGSQLVADRLAERLARPVELDWPVAAIRQDSDRVVVSGPRGELAGAHAIVAIPPPLAARIAFEPPLPAARDQLMQRMPSGSLIKCMAIYDEPFWRRDGFSGEALSDNGPVSLTFDNSPPGGEPGVLLGFVGGADARELARRPADERRSEVLACLTKLFGERAASPTGYIEQDWAAEPWSRGGPTSLMPPGTWTSFGPALRAPVGRIHWAGTETATVWCGYMEGAVRSGERAAAELAEPA